VNGRRLRRLSGALAGLALAFGCTSGGNDGGSNTNWWKCESDQDCHAYERCVAHRCSSLDASGIADHPLRLELDASRYDGGVCAGEAYRAELAPVDASLLDAYLMIDQSSSMGDAVPGGTSTWWSALQAGIASFVNAPGAAGMGVGMQYFPLGGMAPSSCNADYSTPEVDIAALPGNAGALVSSVQAHTPVGFTPTGPALTGAIQHMKAWATSHPGRVPVVVLVTDGFPTECSPTQITDVAAIAQAALATEPRVRTFVIGLNLGTSGANLNAVARAGGTHTAFLISSSDLPTELTAGMLSIAVAPLKCVFTLPLQYRHSGDSGAFDPSLFALRYIPSGGAPQDVPPVASVAECAQHGGQGFYFDPPDAPTQVVACPGTCAGGDGGTLELVVHCPPPSTATR